MTDKSALNGGSALVTNAGAPVQLQVALDWSGVESLPLFFATHFVSSLLGPDGVVLVVGQAVPPIFGGTPEEQTAAIREVKMIDARPHTRLILNPVHLRELIAVLQESQRMIEGIPIQTTNELPPK